MWERCPMPFFFARVYAVRAVDGSVPPLASKGLHGTTQRVQGLRRTIGSPDGSWLTRARGTSEAENMKTSESPAIPLLRKIESYLPQPSHSAP